MPIGPRPLRDFIDASSSLDVLLSRIRGQNRLLTQVTAELPQPLDRHCRAVLAKGRTLLVFTDSPAWASRLRFYSRELTRRLRTRGHVFDRIKVRVLIIGSPDPIKSPVRRNISSANAALLQQVAESISDPALRAAMQRLGKLGPRRDVPEHPSPPSG